jgi:hypothetical protein
MSPDPPWEPPIAGSEPEQLEGSLERLRLTFRWKTAGLGASELRARIGASSLTLGGLLKHLAAVEHLTFSTKLDGSPLDAPWAPWDKDWQFTSAATDAPEQLYAAWDDAVRLSRTRLRVAVAHRGLDQPVHLSMPDGRQANLRRLLCDLLEEYGRHTGHADLLREAIDGRVGEDPPEEWRPDAPDQ